MVVVVVGGTAVLLILVRRPQAMRSARGCRFEALGSSCIPRWDSSCIRFAAGHLLVGRRAAAVATGLTVPNPFPPTLSLLQAAPRAASSGWAFRPLQLLWSLVKWAVVLVILSAAFLSGSQVRAQRRNVHGYEWPCGSVCGSRYIAGSVWVPSWPLRLASVAPSSKYTWHATRVKSLNTTSGAVNVRARICGQHKPT